MKISTTSFTLTEASFNKDQFKAVLCGVAGMEPNFTEIEFPVDSYVAVKLSEKKMNLGLENSGNLDPLAEHMVNRTLGQLDIWGGSKDEGNLMALRAAEIIRCLLEKVEVLEAKNNG